MKIAIFHMNQLGDMMFSLPMIYNLQQNCSGTLIYSISKSDFVNEFLTLTSLIDKTVIRPKSLFKKIDFINWCKKEKFDLSIHISQSIDSTIAASLSDIPERIGFKSALLSFLYTKQVEFNPPPSIENNLRLLEPLGVKISKTDYLGLINVSSLQKQNYIKNLGIEEKDFVVVIAPGVSKRRKHKMWSEEKFGLVIKYLSKNYFSKCILIGTRTEYLTCKNILRFSPECNVINLAGKTTLRDLCRIFSRTNLFIGVDSGVMHLAAAMDVSIVALFGETNPEIVGPQNKRKIIVKKNTTNEISVEEVINAIETLRKI